MADIRRAFKIITDKRISDHGTELRIIESNAEQDLYMMMIVGGILIFVAILW